MPNWCFNNVSLEGPTEDVSKAIAQLATPYETTEVSWDTETSSYKRESAVRTGNFLFWNVVKPTNLEAYYKMVGTGDPDNFSDPDNWYIWNNRNWGTKWETSDSEITDLAPSLTITHILYSFNTAWAPPIPVVEELSKQYPTLTVCISYEEEQGWGGEMTFQNGEVLAEEQYDNRCHDCDRHNVLSYCEKCDEDVCTECGWQSNNGEYCEHQPQKVVESVSTQA